MNTNAALAAIPAPAGAQHVDEWRHDDIDGHYRWFRYPVGIAGGGRVTLHGIQTGDGTISELAISIRDKRGDTIEIDASAARALAAALNDVAAAAESIDPQ